MNECVVAFADGDGPYYLPDAPFTDNLAPDSDGDRLIVSGKLVNSDCTKTIPNAVIDIWQADEFGEYQDETHRGQIRTNSKGEYEFETVIPKGYGEGSGYRPPHIHFKVWVDEKLIVTSEMFFEDVRGREGFNNAYILDLSKKGDMTYGKHNIVLP